MKKLANFLLLIGFNPIVQLLGAAACIYFILSGASWQLGVTGVLHLIFAITLIIYREQMKEMRLAICV